MKTKGRKSSTNIEDRRKNKLKSPYSGLPLSTRFSRQEDYVKKKIKKRGRTVQVTLRGKVYNGIGGGYR